MAIEREKMRQVLQESNEEVLNSTLVRSLSINKLGIYNCDQIIKEVNAIEIFANYVNSRGKKIEPVLIYLIDNTRNGLVRFDGSFGYSPYRFKYNHESTNTIIAIDINKESYVIPSIQFKNVKIANMRAKHEFVLDKITKLKSKEDLKARL